MVYSDGELSDEELTLEFAGVLRRAGPWGQHFPEPVFDDEFEVLESRTVGGSHLKMRVRRTGGSRVLDAIAFYFEGPEVQGEVDSPRRLVYTLDVNEYRGMRKPQLIVHHLLPG